MTNYCAQPQAHPDRCGCEPDAFQIARHSRRLVEQQRERIAALEAENAALKHRCGMFGLELENAEERQIQAERQVAILRQHKTDYMGAAEETRRALEGECERLRQFEVAYNDWQAKTDWVQESAKPHELGRHRADVLRARIEALAAQQGEAVEVAQVVSYLSACADGYDPDAPHPGPPEPLMTVAQHNRIVAALSAQQSAQPEFCCEHSYKVAKQAAWGARELTQCKCDHNEYCEHCWPDDFREGGKWHGGFETKQSAPERVSVPVELLERVCWPVVSGSDRHTHSEAVAEIRAILASHAEGGKV